jgi:hypothetical protein
MFRTGEIVNRRRHAWVFAFSLLLSAAAAAVGEAAPQSIAIPAYFYPSYPDPLWTRMEDAVPAVSFAIMNPANGAGAAPDSNYISQVAATRAAGVKVLGYVYSSYAARDAALLRADIDNYYTWYGVDGIFIDEADNTCVNQPYYAGLDTYVKTKGGLAMTVINPGTITPECFATAADVILNFEGSYAQYLAWAPYGWESAYDASRFWHLVYATSESDMPAAILASQSRGAGYVYVTPDTLVNPWDSLPSGSYWTTELAYVQPGTGGCPLPVAKARLQVRGVFTPEADDALKLSGSFTLGGTPTVDPVASGLRFVVSDQSGVEVDATIAAGPYDDGASFGWLGASGKWMYRDDRDPAAGGITKATVRTRSDGLATTVTVKVFGKDGSYPVSAAELPLEAAFLLEPDEPTTNCATATFTAPEQSCAATSTGIRCK